MRILTVGDVVGNSGTEYIGKHLWTLRKQYAVDMVIANGENSHQANGITPKSADVLFNAGVDVITTGNHVYKRNEVYDYLNEKQHIIRPANFPKSCPGSGYVIFDTGNVRVLVINVMGLIYMESMADPFETAEKILAECEGKYDISVIDIHAEATSEKRALGFYLDGRAGAVFGTHTHVQTADEQILPKGTGYITDLGMTGPIQSVLGINPETAIKKFTTKMPVAFTIIDGEAMLNGAIFEFAAGKCVAIERINIS